jgi:ATP-binding cassette subfamily B protein
MSEKETASAETESVDEKLTKVNRIPDYEFLFAEPDGKPVKKSAFFGRLIRMNFGRILLSLFLFVVKSAALWVMPLVIADIINIAVLESAAAFWQRLLIDGIILVAVLVQNIPTHIIYSRVTDKMTRSVSAGLKSALVKKLQRLSITYHKEMESGKIQSKFLRDIESVDALFGNLIRGIIPNILQTLIFVGIAFSKSGWISLFFLAAIPLNLFIVFAYRRMLSKNSRLFRKANESLSSSLTIMLEMHVITKSHGLEWAQYKLLRNRIAGVTDKGLKADRAIASFGSYVWVLGQLLGCACVVLCAVLAFKKIISVGDIVLYQTMFMSINGYVQGIINAVPQLTAGFEAVRSVSEIMTSHEVEKEGGVHVSTIRGDIKLEDVSFKYHDSDEYVVKHLNLHIKQGECVALVGASGSGKSTVLNMIIGLLPKYEGRLLIDDIPLTELDLTEYRHNLAVVPQNALLFPGSVRENITYGLSGYTEAQFQRVLEMANINEFLKDLENGADTNIGEHGGLLSGGQRQRITIARALIRDPRILILDEATSALDNISEFQVQKAIAASVKDRTTLIVAHRLSTIRNADYIVVMKNGECVEQGTFAELVAKGGDFYELEKLSTPS